MIQSVHKLILLFTVHGTYTAVFPRIAMLTSNFLHLTPCISILCVQALTLSRVERELRQHKLYRYVSMHTASFWAKSFMEVCMYLCMYACMYAYLQICIQAL
jgi:hypothetical protein